MRKPPGAPTEETALGPPPRRRSGSTIIGLPSARRSPQSRGPSSPGRTRQTGPRRGAPPTAESRRLEPTSDATVRRAWDGWAGTPRWRRIPRASRGLDFSRTAHTPHLETPADPAFFNIVIVSREVRRSSSVGLDRGELVVTRRGKVTLPNVDRLRRAGFGSRLCGAKLASSIRSSPTTGRLSALRTTGQAELLAMLHRPGRARFRGRAGRIPTFSTFGDSERTQPKAAADRPSALRRRRFVEVSYFQPIPFYAADTIALDDDDRRHSTTGLLSPVACRRRRRPSHAWFAGGRGQGIRIADIEAGWNLGHEDLPGLVRRRHQLRLYQRRRRHGSAR